MPDPERRPSFWAELKRRRVYRVAAVYVVVAVGVWQVADIVVPVLGLPDLIMKLVVIGPILTFPFAMVLAWAYDITPDGVRPADAESERTVGDGVHEAGAAGSRARRMPPAVVRRAAVGTVVTSAIVAGGWWGIGSRIGDGEAELSEVSLAVFPFTVRGDGLTYMREGIVDLLNRNLTGASDLQPVDPSLMRKATGGTDPAGAIEAGSVARRIGAGQFVTGEVNSLSDQVRIDASLYALGDSVELLGGHTVQGDTTRIFELIDELTAGLLSELRRGAVSERIVRTAATTTSSLPALKAYLEGEQQYRLGEHKDAADAFQRALEADSSFALAHYRLAMTHHMRREHDLAHREIQGAERHADRLTQHDRDVIAAFAAFHSGSITAAERQLRSIVREYPRDLEARVILAELLMAYAPSRGEPLSEARYLLEKVLEADPKFMCVYCQLTGLLVDEGDIDGAERLMRLLEGEETGDTTKASSFDRFQFGILRRDSAEVEQALADMDTLPDDEWRHTVIVHLGPFAVGQGRFDLVTEILNRSATRAEPGADQEYLKGVAAVARGEWRSAYAHMEAEMRLRSRQPPLDVLVYYRLLELPFEMRVDGLDALRQRLVDWNEGGVRTYSPSDRDWPERLRPSTRLYLLGLVMARLGDDRAALAYADSLAGLTTGIETDSTIFDGLARVVRADVALRSNDPATALRELDGVSADVPPSQLLVPWVTGLFHAPQVRVRAYLDAGEPEKALQWLRRGIAAYGEPPPNLYGVYHRDMAYALDALGRTDEAAEHFARFIEAWDSADEELQPQVRAARERLAALSGDRH